MASLKEETAADGCVLLCNLAEPELEESPELAEIPDLVEETPELVESSLGDCKDQQQPCPLVTSESSQNTALFSPADVVGFEATSIFKAEVEASGPQGQSQISSFRGQRQDLNFLSPSNCSPQGQGRFLRTPFLPVADGSKSSVNVCELRSKVMLNSADSDLTLAHSKSLTDAQGNGRESIGSEIEADEKAGKVGEEIKSSGERESYNSGTNFPPLVILSSGVMNSSAPHSECSRDPQNSSSAAPSTGSSVRTSSRKRRPPTTRTEDFAVPTAGKKRKMQ